MEGFSEKTKQKQQEIKLKHAERKLKTQAKPIDHENLSMKTSLGDVVDYRQINRNECICRGGDGFPVFVR